MRKSLFTIFFILLLDPSLCLGEWIRLFSINKGDLYLETASIKRNGENIFFSQLVNYRRPESNGILSYKIHSQIDCTNLKTKDLNYETFKQKMGRGKNFYNGTPNRNWKGSKPGSSIYFLNEVLCDRVSQK
jgi:hypothetical protein